jgi:hypothetical protein
MKIVRTTLDYNRSTPGTHLFKNENEGAPISALYIKKSAFNGDAPPVMIKIEVTPHE